MAALALLDAVNVAKALIGSVEGGGAQSRRVRFVNGAGSEERLRRFSAGAVVAESGMSAAEGPASFRYARGVAKGRVGAEMTGRSGDGGATFADPDDASLRESLSKP